MAQQLEKIFIERLKREQAEWSHAALAQPKDQTSFGFGQASGMYLGLNRAEKLLLEILEEEDDRT